MDVTFELMPLGQGNMSCLCIERLVPTRFV